MEVQLHQHALPASQHEVPRKSYRCKQQRRWHAGHHHRHDARLHPRRAVVPRDGVGDHYHYHTDTGGAPVIAGRAITALLYLTDGFDGGETSFPLAGTGETRNNVHRVREEFRGCDASVGLAVAPTAGHAVIFYNHLPNSAAKDFATWHASCDVTTPRATKYAANLWFHLEKARQRLRVQQRR